MILSLVFDTSGTARLVYADELRPVLQDLGSVSIMRASHVEPDDQGRWWADLAPVDGPALGPYELRGDALRDEVAWLEDHLSRN